MSCSSLHTNQTTSTYSSEFINILYCRLNDAIKYNDMNTFHMILNEHEDKVYLDNSMIIDSISHGNLQMLKKLIKLDCPRSVYDDYLEHSIHQGQAEITRYILQNMCKFVFEPICPNDLWSFFHDSRIPSLELMNVLLKNNVYWSLQTFTTNNLYSLRVVFSHPDAITRFIQIVRSYKPELQCDDDCIKHVVQDMLQQTKIENLYDGSSFYDLILLQLEYIA